MSNRPAAPPDAADPTRPSAAGILHCLRMLADEAATLKLAGTLEALRAAIAVCAAESDGQTPTAEGLAGALLH